MKCFVCFALCALFAFGCTPWMKPPEFSLNGVIPVEYSYERLLPGHAGSQYDYTTGVCTIYMHPDRWYGLNAREQWFVWAHEVAHCEARSEGHRAGEFEADCEAKRKLQEMGLWDDLMELSIVEMLSKWPGSHTHPPGVERAIELILCEQ